MLLSLRQRSVHGTISMIRTRYYHYDPNKVAVFRLIVISDRIALIIVDNILRVKLGVTLQVVSIPDHTYVVIYVTLVLDCDNCFQAENVSLQRCELTVFSMALIIIVLSSHLPRSRRSVLSEGGALGAGSKAGGGHRGHQGGSPGARRAGGVAERLPAGGAARPPTSLRGLG